MPKHLTVVFDVKDWSTDEIRALTDEASYLAWGHVPHQRDRVIEMLKEALEEILDRLCADEPPIDSYAELKVTVEKLTKQLSFLYFGERNELQS